MLSLGVCVVAPVGAIWPPQAWYVKTLPDFLIMVFVPGVLIGTGFVISVSAIGSGVFDINGTLINRPYLGKSVRIEASDIVGLGTGVGNNYSAPIVKVRSGQTVLLNGAAHRVTGAGLAASREAATGIALHFSVPCD